LQPFGLLARNGQSESAKKSHKFSPGSSTLGHSLFLSFRVKLQQDLVVAAPSWTLLEIRDVFFMRPRFGEIQRGLSADKGSGVPGLRNVLGFAKMTTAIAEVWKTA
jgi:hypothetical protein